MCRRARSPPGWTDEGLAPSRRAWPGQGFLRMQSSSSPPHWRESLRRETLRDQTVTCVPTSTTRPVGIWKKFVASVALLVRLM